MVLTKVKEETSVERDAEEIDITHRVGKKRKTEAEAYWLSLSLINQRLKS